MQLEDPTYYSYWRNSRALSAGGAAAAAVPASPDGESRYTPPGPAGAITSSRAPRVDQQPSSVPIYQTATFSAADAQELGDVAADGRAGYAYSRISNPTTSALGAAYAAGIAVGFWQGEQDVIDNWAEDKRWEPSMDEAVREKTYRNWKKAVTKSFDWVDADTDTE